MKALFAKIKKAFRSMLSQPAGPTDHDTVCVIPSHPDECGWNDGTVYVTEPTLVDVVSEAMPCLRTSSGTDNAHNNRLFKYYNFCIDKSQLSKQSPMLYTLLGDRNTFIPLFTPDTPVKQYIAVRLTKENAEAKLREMMDRCEKICYESMLNSVRNIGMSNPATFSYIIDEIYNKKQLTSACDVARGKEGDENSDHVDYRRERELYASYLSNCAQLKVLYYNHGIQTDAAEKQDIESKIAKLREETDYVLQDAGVGKDLLQDILLMHMELPHNVRKHVFEERFNRFAMAEKCPLSIEIREMPDEVKNQIADNSTDGAYRVFIHSGNEERQIKFARRDSCLIYMMYLTDRKFRRQAVGSLNVKNYETTFCELYKTVYPPKIDDAKSGRRSKNEEMENEICLKAFREMFETPLVKGVDGRLRYKQQNLKTIYSDMRRDIKNTVDALMEKESHPLLVSGKLYYSPINVPSMHSHLTVKPKKIVVPNTIRTICKDLLLV